MAESVDAADLKFAGLTAVPVRSRLRAPSLSSRKSQGVALTGEDVASAIARDDGEGALAAQCRSIADNAGDDYRFGPKSRLVEADSEARSKLRIWTRPRRRAGRCFPPIPEPSDDR